MRLFALSNKFEILTNGHEFSCFGELEVLWLYAFIKWKLFEEWMMIVIQSEPNPADEDWIDGLRIGIVSLKMQGLPLNLK